MAAEGATVRRKRYLPAGEVRPIYSDAWVEDRQTRQEIIASTRPIPSRRRGRILAIPNQLSADRCAPSHRSADPKTDQQQQPAT
jgi:hypothetical protein